MKRKLIIGLAAILVIILAAGCDTAEDLIEPEAGYETIKGVSHGKSFIS